MFTINRIAIVTTINRIAIIIGNSYQLLLLLIDWGRRLHARDRPLRNHCRFPVAFPNGLSVAFSKQFNVSVVYSQGLSLVQWIFTGVSNGSSVAFSNGTSLLCFLACNISPRAKRNAEGQRTGSVLWRPPAQCHGRKTRKLARYCGFLFQRRVFRFRSLAFEQRNLGIVFKTSRDHLLVWDSSRLSIEIVGILGRKTAVRGRSCVCVSHTNMSSGPSHVSAQTQGPSHAPAQTQVCVWCMLLPHYHYYYYHHYHYYYD